MVIGVKFSGFGGVFWQLGCVDDISVTVLPARLEGLGNPRVGLHPRLVTCRPNAAHSV